MKRILKPFASATIVVGSLGLATAGWAFWTTLGTGSGAAGVGTISAPTSVSVPATSAGSVSVSWTASSTAAPNVAPTGYFVQRFGGSPSPAAACSTSPTALVTTVSCNDTGVTDGTYTYQVTAVFRSWTAPSASSGQVAVTSLTLSSISPASRGQGATNQAVTLTGTGFASGATVSFSGTGITVNSTGYVSATQITANVSVGSSASTSARDVTVTNPSGKTATLSGGFTVNPAPTVTAVSPNNRGRGAANQSIVITGTGFVSGAAASFGGSGVTVNSTTVNSSTQLTANITVSATATLGARDVMITNGDGGVATLAGGFTVNAGPAITSPTAAATAKVKKQTTATVTVTGTGFQSGAAYTISGEFTGSGTVTFISSTQITVSVTAPSGNNKKGDITVTNPDGGTTTSANSLESTN